MKTHTRNALALTFVLWLLLSATLAAFIYRSGMATALALTRSHAEVQGHVLRKESHYAIEYTFDFNGRQFANTAAEWDTAVYFAKRVGDDIPVYFVPSNPNISSLTNPEEGLGRAKMEMLYGSVFFPIATLPILFWGSYRMTTRASA